MQDGAMRDETMNWISRLLIWLCKLRDGAFGVVNYRISRPIRRTFPPKKCDLNSTCVLCAKGKYYFQTYKCPYTYYTTSLS